MARASGHLIIHPRARAVKRGQENNMKTYAVDIAPGYGPGMTGSLTDGRHGCTVTAADMDSAVAVIWARSENESWPAGEAMVTELDKFGQRVDRPGHYPRRIKI